MIKLQLTRMTAQPPAAAQLEMMRTQIRGGVWGHSPKGPTLYYIYSLQNFLIYSLTLWTKSPYPPLSLLISIFYSYLNYTIIIIPLTLNYYIYIYYYFYLRIIIYIHRLNLEIRKSYTKIIYYITIKWQLETMRRTRHMSQSTEKH